MQEPVDDRCEQDGRRGQEGDAAVQRVKRREHFPGRGPEHIDRPHAGQDHRGVERRVQPGEPLCIMIADRP